MSKNAKENSLKNFFIKLTAIVFAIIIIINVSYNLILADKMESINKLLLINNKENIEFLKDKVRIEIKKGLEKDRILKNEDAALIKQIIQKLKNEIESSK